jgi:nucleoid-associated protein EbfC
VLPFCLPCISLFRLPQGGNNPLGALGNMGNLMESVRKAQQLVQEETKRMQAELSVAEIEGFSSDETVRVVMSGQQEPKNIDITQAAYDQGAEKLEKLVGEAMKDAHAKSVDYMKNEMKGMAQRLGLPPGYGGL